MVALALLGALTLPATAAQAHGGLSGGVLQVTLRGTSALVHATPSPSLFSAFDTDASGTLEQAEVDAQRDEMLDHFFAVFDLIGSWGAPARIALADINPPPHLHAGEAPYVRVTLRLEWSTAPGRLYVRYAAGDVAPLRVAAVRSGAGGEGLRTTGELAGEDASMVLFE